jgi:hypothetical protein
MEDANQIREQPDCQPMNIPYMRSVSRPIY